MAKKESILSSPYTKMRNSFGRQPRFCCSPTVLLDNIEPNIMEQKEYCLRNPVHRDTQTSLCISEQEVNTKRAIFRDHGANHSEGGWPKEINCLDEEATTRYRRKIERDENYVDAVLSLYPELAHYINQNNGIEMYNLYFKGMPTQEPVEKYSINLNNVFKDPDNRPISCIEWTKEPKPKLVVSYCNKKYPVSGPINQKKYCFMWNIENPCDPFADFCPPSACWQVACSPVQPTVIIGGLNDGRVCIFDIRAKKEPIGISKTHISHRDPVTSLLYINARLNNEFFSGSTDGRCMWWDVRNISRPVDELIMSIRIPPGEQISLANAEGVSVLQYEKSIPTKFLCGTDTGFVINVNRKGKTYQEIMSATFQAHIGPVKSLHRSPCATKVFITCGDWRVNIWNDDIRTSPIISGTRHRHQISDVVWAPQRVSSYMSIGYDGKFRYWDLLRKIREPILLMPLANCSLLKIKVQEAGKLIAIGDMKGSLYLLSVSKNLVHSGDKDKQLMIQTFDRETKREHILETRVKEIRLKARTEVSERSQISIPNTENYESIVKNTEEVYRQIVSDELRRKTEYSSIGGKIQRMRKR